MSDESKVNPDLKKVEAQLGKLSIPGVSIDRDEMMYQSGWAAAIAEMGRESDVSDLPIRNAKHRDRIWPAVACLASAATVVLGTFTLIEVANDYYRGSTSRARKSGTAQIAATETADTTESDLEKSKSTDDPVEIIDVFSILNDVPDGQVLTSGLSFHQPLSSVSIHDSSHQPASDWNLKPVNQRQLMNELLAPGNGLSERPAFF